MIYCAVESTARHNPDRDVHMLLPRDFPTNNIPGYFASFKRVQFRAVDYAELIRGSEAGLPDGLDQRNSSYNSG